MRASLFYNPRVIVERLAMASQRRRRRSRLRGTPAAALSLGHIDSLELLETMKAAPPAVIYDVGANVGTWTCLAKSLYPRAKVEAFEPLAEHESGFRRWTSFWPGDVRLHSFALGPHRGTAEMTVTDFTDASSLLPLAPAGRDEFHIAEARRQTVPVETLDGLAASGIILPPNLIKLDVQGYELEVLRGATQCLQSARWVLCEVSFKRFYERQALFSDILSFLVERHFKLHAFGHGLAIGEPLVQADALFIRES